MNVLLERLPTTVEISGKLYEINSDFRNCLSIILAFEDPDLTEYEKRLIMLELLYNQMPDDIVEACRVAVKFLNCGEEIGIIHNPKARLYSFEKDAQYIYTAISQSHNIDLETVEYLHWWKFCYMFLDVGEDCFFSHLVDLRARKSKNKLTKEEKEFCNNNPDLINLPKLLSAEEIIAQNEILKILGERE
jgi:hypothetical protein